MNGKYFRKGCGKSEAFPTGGRRIAVVGLRKAQAGMVRRKCDGIARVNCVNADRSDVRLPQCDDIILMTKFIEHRWTESAYRSFPRDRVHLHGGGTSLLLRKIAALAGRSTA